MPKRYWWKDAKIYELYADRFAGTFQNLCNQLDYLDRLGVNALHILPHYPSPMADGGYDVMEYLNVRPELGTLEDFDAFVKEAHRRGIKIIIDFVLNHVSEHHPWFLEARSSKDNNKRDYFLWSETGQELSLGWNAFPDIKPGNWILNEATGDYFYATFYPQQPDLNWDNQAVFDGMMQNMDFWAGRGVDGFRLDAAVTLIKRDGTLSKGLPETHALIKRIRKHLDTKFGGEIILLAEAHQDVAEMKTYFGEGDECHLVYHFSLTEQLFLALMRDDRTALDRMIEESKDIPVNCQWALFLRNHDELSLATIEPDVRRKLIDYLDPEHDYIFNSGAATAKRLGSMFDDAKMREAISLLYSLPGAPIMYYGDEIGMRNLPVQDGVFDSRVYVRGEFDWLEASLQRNDPDSLFNFTRTVIRQSFWPYGAASSPNLSLPEVESPDDVETSHL
jgi:maltose alpha-D-glucosyltransferase/alpha-amylase